MYRAFELAFDCTLGADRRGAFADRSEERQASLPIAPLPPIRPIPRTRTAALAHARELRASNAKPEALAVLDRAAAAKPGDRRLQLERGLLALELGDAAKAEKLLRQAHDPKAPDWRLHSALGAALASRGKQQEAQVELAKALALAPDQPSVLNNLALSYALDGKVARSRAAAAQGRSAAPARTPQMQENLALVLGLRGSYDEARSAGQAALPPAKADAERGLPARAGPGAVRGEHRCGTRRAGGPRARPARACRNRPISWAVRAPAE